MIVYRTFRIHASRFLPNLDDSHICKRMHGHTFNITVYVNGKIDKKTGFVMDFYDIDTIFNKYIQIVDYEEDGTAVSKILFSSTIHKIINASKNILLEKLIIKYDASSEITTNKTKLKALIFEGTEPDGLSDDIVGLFKSIYHT